LTQAQLEREYQETYDYVICDRSIVDNYIYAQEAYEKEDQPLPNWIEPFVLHHSKTYDYLFKTPLSPMGLVDDKTRSIDREWQQQIDERLKVYLEEKKIKHIELPVSEVFEYDDIIEYATKQAKFMAAHIIDMDVQKRII
jgi:hypothetical protein